MFESIQNRRRMNNDASKNRFFSHHLFTVMLAAVKVFTEAQQCIELIAN